MTLVLNAIYGLSLVVIHALLLGDASSMQGERASASSDEGSEYRSSEYGQDRRVQDFGSTAARDAPTSHHASWLLQLVDLDIGWGHELLGFDDYNCLLSGLLYGIIVVCLCAYMFNAVMTGGPTLPTTSRWFVAFMNLEIVLFVALALAKLPKACRIQEEFLPKLEMECSLFRFLYVQRVAVMALVAGFGCWVFSSLAYFLSFGFQAIDRPEYAQHLEMHEAHAQAAQHGVDPSFAPVPAHHLAAASMAGTSKMLASFDRRPVGEAIHVGPNSMGTGSRPPMRTSYNIPRASTSQASTTTSDSRTLEYHPLIKQPVALF
jgi:hypothetical protein